MLRTTVRVKADPEGQQMILPWSGDQSTQYGTSVTLEIDNRKCEKLPNVECFPATNAAAQFLAASAAKHGLPAGLPIYEVRGEDQQPLSPGAQSHVNLTYIVIGAFGVVMAALLIGVLVSAQRKRAQGITWFPEGFLRTSSGQRRQSRRRGPDGQEMRNLNKQASSNRVDVDPNDRMSVPGDGRHWPEEDVEHPPIKRMKSEKPDSSYSDHTTMTDFDENDHRQWTQQHLEAADVRNPDILALTPPQGG